MQSFCLTAAYPKLVDVRIHRELPSFISTRGGVALRPGDGVIHSWLNRLLLPDTVGTGGDSHTRFLIGISFPTASWKSKACRISRSNKPSNSPTPPPSVLPPPVRSP
jgi:aconitase B